jgi:hypothetical protein
MVLMGVAVSVAWFVRVAVRMPFRDGFGRGEHKSTGFNPLGADEAVRQFTNFAHGTSEKDDLKASAMVEMDVGCGHDPVEVHVLDLGQSLGDPAGMMIVNDRDDPHREALFIGDHLLDQGVTHEAANGLAPIGVMMLLAILIELAQEFSTDRDAEPNERIFQGIEPPVGCRAIE